MYITIYTYSYLLICSTFNGEKAATASQKTKTFTGSSSTESTSKSNINIIVITQLVIHGIILYEGTASDDQHDINQNDEESTNACNKGN